MALQDRGPRGTTKTRPGTCRARILEYIAGRGGELRSDTGVGIRRQIADALGERPTAVGQALLGLERGGFIERELDRVLHRCHAIRLLTPGQTPAPNPSRVRRRPSEVSASAPDYGELVDRLQAQADLGDENAASWEKQVKLATRSLRADRDRLERRLKETEQELGDAIRRGAELARRIEDLESILEIALPDISLLDGDEEESPPLLVALDPELWWASAAGGDRRAPASGGESGDRRGRGVS